jgi:antirestriction protein ArdC
MAKHSASRSGSSKHGTPRDHYAAVTDQVIAALEAGTLPWRKPWDPDKAAGPGTPQNATTGARYKGINCLLLGISPLTFNSGDPRWCTYKQAAERGWQVRKGERSTTAFFFKRIEVPNGAEAASGDDEATRRIPMLRAFPLFHASQMDHVPDFVPPTLAEAPWLAPEAAETVVANSGAAVRVGGDRAFYAPSTDHIQMPPRQAFRSAAGWSNTILHELAHWFGNEARLNRDLRNNFGSHDYAREEVRVEMAMSYLCAELSIQCDFPNSLSYIAFWLELCPPRHNSSNRKLAIMRRNAAGCAVLRRSRPHSSALFRACRARRADWHPASMTADGLPLLERRPVPTPSASFPDWPWRSGWWCRGSHDRASCGRP